MSNYEFQWDISCFHGDAFVAFFMDISVLMRDLIELNFVFLFLDILIEVSFSYCQISDFARSANFNSRSFFKSNFSPLFCDSTVTVTVKIAN